MLNRQKVILELLKEAPRTPARIDLMKWLFLLRHETDLGEDPAFYDFVPYKYGPFSFTVYRELAGLAQYGYLDAESFKVSTVLTKDINKICDTLPRNMKTAIRYVVQLHAKKSQDELIDYVYSRYPWFATRSEIRSVSQPKPRPKKAIYTAGYEGESVERFLQKLLKTGVKQIVDVRRNPLSRKYGFSKGALSSLAEKMNLIYVHIPELGVPSSMRMKLECYEDYQKLMGKYERALLPKAIVAQDDAARIVRKAASVLVCFESDVMCCHRSRLATALSKKTGMEVLHL
jgi:uncharacterized protein (DUF488 family)